MRRSLVNFSKKKNYKSKPVCASHSVSIIVVCVVRFENGGDGEQAGERRKARVEQQHGDKRVPNRILHRPGRKVHEAAKQNRGSRGGEGLPDQVEQGHQADLVGLEATALRRSRLRLRSRPSR